LRCIFQLWPLPIRMPLPSQLSAKMRVGLFLGRSIKSPETMALTASGWVTYTNGCVNTRSTNAPGLADTAIRSSWTMSDAGSSGLTYRWPSSGRCGAWGNLARLASASSCAATARHT